LTFRDLITTAAMNLWRMKLRSVLTFSGIIIAIAAFVAILSFGVGMQRNIKEQFDELGLLSIVQVFPKDAEENDSIPTMKLDDDALEYLEKLPGVELVYPYEDIELKVSLGDSVQTVTARTLSRHAARTKQFSHLAAGRLFDADSSREVLISENLSRALGVEPPDSILGRAVTVVVEVARIDSGIGTMIQPLGEIIEKRIEEFRVDSLRKTSRARKVVREEMSGALRRFMDGFMNNRDIVADTLTVCGITKTPRGGLIRMKDLIIPVATARKLSSGGFSGNITEIMAAVRSGNLFENDHRISPGEYAQATVVMRSDAAYEPIRDSIRAAGLATFSFAEELENIRRFFRFFNLALGLVGLIALMTASLGIINTMIMAITERRREIGIWMSLGADRNDIRRLFLVESGLIGLAGSMGGVIFGWIISRIGSLVAVTLMERQGVPSMEMFHIPLWLVLIALTFGIIVSIMAGYYPANRAARVDPVVSLRNE